MTLDEIRVKIDAIDTQLLKLLNERADLVHEVGVIKKRDGLEIYAPEREEALLRRLVEKSEGRLPEKSIRAIYREIMSAALALEEDLKIAYLGPKGTWTHQAAIEKFGGSVHYLPQFNLSDVFDQVHRGLADYGVVPIENTTEGAVRHTLDLFAKTPLKICAQLLIPVHVCLMSLEELNDIRKVFGHPGVLAQSRDWLRQHLGDAEQVTVSSTERAATLAKEEEGSAAVGSLLAARINQVPPIARNIENETHTTRFVVVGRRECPPTGNDMTAICVADEINTTSVIETLRALADLEVDVAQMESHPTGKKDRFSFYLEIKGHITEPHLQQTVRTLEGKGQRVTVLGSFPRPAALD